MTELCYLTRDAVKEISYDYTELRSRILRFRHSNRALSDKTLAYVGMSREELQSTAVTYKKKLETTQRIRREKNLDDSANSRRRRCCRPTLSF